MKYASNTSQQVGVDFEHLAAYVTVISSTTRQSAEMIGQAMRTIFTRMSDVSNAKAIDAEGDAINNVEKSLKRVGIELRDSKDTFRDMQDVIGEIGQRWESFSEADQNFIARQIAGKNECRNSW